MARYGSGKEDFDDEAAKIRARRLAREAMIAKEEQYQRSVAVTSGLESDVERKRVAQNLARREAADVAKREASVAGRSVGNINLDTAAIQRNTEARKRNAALRREEEKLRRSPPALAVAGARDPAFAAAHRLAQQQGGDISQYQIRQQLEGVGSRRAAALQAAVARGFKPTGRPEPAFAPLTRSQAADLELQRSKQELAERTRALARVIGQKSTPAEEVSALAARDAARARVQAANAELKSAVSEAPPRPAPASAAAEQRAREHEATQERIKRERAAHDANVAAIRAEREAPARQPAPKTTVFEDLDARSAASRRASEAATRVSELEAEARKAEGKQKAAQTRLRNLENAPFVAPKDYPAHSAKIDSAREAVERARVKSEAARAAVVPARDDAQAAIAAEKQAREVMRERQRASVDSEVKARGENADAVRKEAESHKRAAEAADRAATSPAVAPTTAARPADSQPPSRAHDRPLTQRQSVILDLERSEAELAAANRDRAAVRRRKDATDYDRLTANEAVEDARRARDSAKRQLSSVDAEIAARGSNAEAARREADAHTRAAKAAEAPPPRPGADIIRHPTLYGTGAARTVDYTPPSRVIGPDTPQVDRQRIVDRQPVVERGQLYSGDERIDSAQRNRLAQQEAADAAAAEGARKREQEATERATQATRAHADAISEEQRARAQFNADRVAAYQEQSASATQKSTAALRDSGVAFGTVSNAMHRHGALTTEFIAAAARGQTTLRELGNQSLATVGKFAGWTAAGAALYTAVDAMRQLGAGAIAASDGTSQLQRVVPGAGRDDSMAAFAALATEFNVPVEVAADAVYRMGQRFHSLPEAVEAARSSLYAFQTGELDVETGTKSLLATVNGFGLEASALSQVYDQINEAQNAFGVRIADTTSGVGKAAGAFKNAGGEFSFLLGLIATGTRVTGRSGDNIGTAIQRSVGFIQRPSNQAALEGFGVDPTQDIESVYTQAFEVAKNLRGRELQELATALSSPQYASYFVPILQNYELFQKIIRGTSQAASEDSAQRELEKRLSQISEQAKAVGIGLQNIGVELARSGALVPFAGALKALNLMLDATGALLHTFNILPGPIRTSLALLAQAAVVVAGLRKFGVTDKLAGGPLGFLAAPDKRLKKYAEKGLGDARNEAFGELESAHRREYRATFLAASERQAVSDFEKTPAFINTRGADPQTDPRRQAVDAHHVRLQDRASAAETVRLTALDESRRASIIAAKAEDDLTAVRGTGHRQIRKHLADKGVAIPAQLDAPNTQGTRTVEYDEFDDDGTPRDNTPRVTPGTRGQADIDKLDRATRTPIPSPNPRIERAAAAARYRIANMAVMMEQVGNANRGLGPAASALEKGANKVVAGTAASVTFLGRAAGSMKGSVGGISRMGTGLRNLARSLGPLDLALLGFLAIEGITSQTDKLSKSIDDTEKFIVDYTGKTEQARQALAQRAADLRQNGVQTDSQYTDDALGDFGDFFKPGTWIQRIRGTYVSDSQRRAQNAARILQMQDEQEARKAAQNRAVSRGEPRSELVASDLITYIRQTARDRNEGLITMAEFDRRMALYASEAKGLLNPSKGDTSAVKSTMARALAGVGSSAGNYADVVAGLDAKGVEAEMEAKIAEIEAGSQTVANLDNLAQLYARATALHGGKSDAESIKALAAARKATFDAIEANAQAEVKAGLESATTEGSRRGVYSRAISGLSATRNNLRDRRDQAQEALERAYRLRAINRQRQGRPAVITPLTGTDPLLGSATALATFPQTNSKALSTRARRLAADIRKFKQNVQRFQNELNAANRELARIAGMMKEEAYADREAGRAVDLAYKQSLTTDPVRRAALGTLAAQRQARDAKRTFGKGRRAKEAQTAANEARIAENDARQQASEQAASDAKQRADEAKAAAEEARANAIERVRLLGELAAARAGGDPVLSAKASVSAAQSALRMAGSGNERLQALVDLANANNALEDALKDREVARLEYLSSLTTDPLKRARLAEKISNVNLKGTKGTERYRALADRNAKRQEVIATRVSEREEEIQFNLAMERITSDVAISQYQSLLKTKGLTKSTRRKILQQIKQLQDDDGGGEELNVGNIKLPTLYDIRRMAQQGTNTAPVNMQQNTNYTVNIQNPGDVEAFGAQLDRVHGGSTRAALRSAGYRG